MLKGKDTHMPNLFIRCMLFVSSYFPLALICCLLLFDSQRFWALVILLIGLSGFLIMLVYFLMIVPKKQICVEKVTELQKRDGDVMSYVAGYLIAFITFPLHDWQHLTAVLTFLGVLLIVYVNSNLIYSNPMLNLLGYHLYEARLEHSEVSHFLLIRHRPVRGETVRLAKIGESIFLGERVSTLQPRRHML
jgi:hypothetical protein